MIVDPMQALAGIPAPAATVAPIPTVVPVPSFIEQKATDAGVRTLWVVFVVMVVASVVFTGLAWRIPASKRLYHVITTFITVFASLSYFAMATGHGVAEHVTIVKDHHSHGIPATLTEIHREVYWARYVDWTLTTPLLLLDLTLLAGLSGANILVAIVADIIMILTGLFAAFGTEGSGQKWGWYALACIAYLVVIWELVVHGRTAVRAKTAKVANFYAAIGGFTLLIWTVYPIVWGVADGARKVTVDSEIIAYAVLDILAKPIFGAWLLFTHASIPETNVDVGGFWAHGFASEGAIRINDDDEGA